MKKLLVKEMSFTAASITYLFIVSAFMTFLPGYPILCGAFFTCLGIFYSFQSAREGNDILFSVLLPVKKSDVVRARYTFVVIIEMLSFIIMTIVTIIRMTLMAGSQVYAQNALMNANPMFLGFALLVFTGFNLFFVGGYWKDAYRLGIPFLKAGIIIFLIIGLAESLHHFPGCAALNTSFGMLEIQLTILALSAIIYVVTTLISCRLSIKNFERIDLTL